MHNNRRAYRKRSFLTAYANLGADHLPMPCLVRDLSPCGARIELAEAGEVPRSFDLHINGRDTLVRVETVWRHARQVGVRFVAKTPIDLDQALCVAEG